MPRPTKAELIGQLETAQQRLAVLEQVLRNLRSLAGVLADLLPGLLLMLDENGTIMHAEIGGEWKQRWSSEKLVGQSLSVLVPASALDSLRLLLEQVRQQQQPVVFEHSGIAGDANGIYEWRLGHRPDGGILALVRRLDAQQTQWSGNQRRNSLEMLARVNRLTRLGELVASIAHELDQPLTATLHYAQGCLRRLDNDNFQLEELRHAAQQILQQAHRAMLILDRIRRFLRGQGPPTEPVDLNAVVQESVSLLAGELASDKVELQLQLSSGLPRIRGDAVSLTQVLVNLLRNALDALGNHPRPRILIATQSSPDSVEVIVADNGPGLNPEVQSRLFELFFSTKPQGLGMGLAVSRNIVEAHGGILLAENWEQGARFVIRFPLPQEPPTDFSPTAVS